jgi:tungstate transport system substrate-binding protein
MSSAPRIRCPLSSIDRRDWLTLQLAALAGIGATGPALAATPSPGATRTAERLLQVGVEAALVASGLAARLRDSLRRDTGLVLQWVEGASGSLLPALERGELDAALTSAPETEAALERKGLVHDRRRIALTDHVLVGPKPVRATRKTPASGDPAQVAGGRDIGAALALVAAAGARSEASFIASGEPSGTRAIEQSAWKLAGPHALGPWLRTAGPGPLAALQLARETGGYALVERGVWLAAGAGTGLALLVEDPLRLETPYHVMRPFRSQHPAAKLAVSWLGGPNGQRVVAGFGRGYRRGS